MNIICADGKFMQAEEAVITAEDRGYRYGDGLFETMKLMRDEILLAPLHFSRLFKSMALMQFTIPPFFTKELLTKKIQLLCQKNGCGELARVRLSVSRGQGGLYDGAGSLHYLIECRPLDDAVNILNTNGLITGLYTEIKKNCDAFSNLKSANFLPYVMAALHAKQNKWNDSLLLNTENNIADSTIANVFLIKDGVIKTPAAGQGCIMGVMRRHLLKVLPEAGYKTEETAISVKDLLNADEVFLTNAIKGIRWVRQFENRNYDTAVTTEIYNRFVKTICP